MLERSHLTYPVDEMEKQDFSSLGTAPAQDRAFQGTGPGNRRGLERVLARTLGTLSLWRLPVCVGGGCRSGCPKAPPHTPEWQPPGAPRVSRNRAGSREQRRGSERRAGPSCLQGQAPRVRLPIWK